MTDCTTYVVMFDIMIIFDLVLANLFVSKLLIEYLIFCFTLQKHHVLKCLQLYFSKCPTFFK